MCAALCGSLFAATPEQIEFFEKNIRPVLAEQCYACHSAKTTALAELRLDTRESVLKGGSRGPALTPGDPDASLILTALSYKKLDLQMPPTGKLAEEQIADFRRWIEMGAPDPRDEAPAPVTQTTGYDFEKERKFWAFRPVTQPAVPAAEGETVGPVDAFLAAKLAAAGLEPAPPIDKRALLRRVTYDLTGLPPTREEIAAFLADDSPGAYEQVVERLLASPHYGERWARHWLDVVRYAETNGHEFDNDKLDSWRYRDYVVRALNDDLPYDVFVKEQIAGDLMRNKRLSADGSCYETPIASGAYWLWEVLNSPTDSVKSRADQVDNQLDVLGRAMFGLTVACARCHDHKFDPIPTKDYYSLAGILHSTQMREISINSPERRAEIEATARNIAAVREQQKSVVSGPLASDLDAAAGDPGHPLYPLAKLREPSAEPFSERVAALRAELRTEQERQGVLFDDFSQGYGKWLVEGAAFGDAPTQEPGFPAASSHRGADEFVGIMRTETFRLPKLYIHVRMAGTPDDPRRKEDAGIRFTVWSDDHPSLNQAPESESAFGWRTFTLTKEHNRVGYLQIVDRSRDGHIAVDQIVFSDDAEPPKAGSAPHAEILALLDQPNLDSLPALEAAYGDLAAGLARKAGRSTREQALLDGLVDPSENAEWLTLERKRRELAAALPTTAFAMSSMDADPRDIRVHLRGSHKNLGEPAPRRFLQIVAGENQDPFRNGSGRLELAEWAASPKNPLTARVLVNRVWKHHFGRGIVATPDNFGETGARPSHPELLDWLASDFMEHGWSIKRLHRHMVLSEAYRRDSHESEAAAERDPNNELLSHMPVKRLEAEAIRDAMLAVAGELDPAIGGPSVPPHISEFQDGRGKPKSGPLDGNGRRSLYVGVRRNFITPLFLAFDYPLPISTIGRRGVSAVPSQALILLNNEFVNQQARNWAEREMGLFDSTDERLADMYERAFGRAPLAAEAAQLRAFLAEETDRGEVDKWADLAHVLINTTEFIFVR